MKKMKMEKWESEWVFPEQVCAFMWVEYMFLLKIYPIKFN